MAKSVYSIVLNDDVVAAVDRMAYHNGVSRSAMINRILAQAAGLTTPEQQKADIFSAVEGFLAGQNVLQLLRTGDALMQVRSALQYKYNPSVRYMLELARHGSGYLAELRVGMRTQSSALLADLDAFFRVWAMCEATAHGDENLAYAIQDGRYARRLRLPVREMSTDELGDALAKYVALLDSALKQYFELLPDTAHAERAVQRLYAGAQYPDIAFL